MPMHSFRNMFVAGEHCDKETMEWTKKVFDCPVLDNWWQTGKLSVIKIVGALLKFKFSKKLTSSS